MLSSSSGPDLAEVICVLNANGVIQFATPATAQFFGYRLNKIIGKSALRFLAPDTRQKTAQYWGFLRDDADTLVDKMLVTLVASNGRRVPIRVSAWRLPDGDKFLLVLHLVEHLQDRLETLYSILNEVAGQLDVTTMLATVLCEINRLVPCEYSTVYLTDKTGGAHIWQWDQTQLRDFYVPPGERRAFETTRLIRETNRPLIIDDTKTDPLWTKLDTPNRRPIRSWLGVPLIHHQQFMGELNLDSYRPNTFTIQDAQLAQALATQIAAVVYHAREFEIEQDRAKRFQVLNEISQAISHLDLNSVLELVYRKISELMDTSTFFIGLYDAEAELVRLVGAYDHGKKSPDDTQESDAGITGLVLRTRESLIVHDSAIDPLPDVIIVQDEMPRSLLMMPLITQEEMVGVISVQSYKPHAYTPGDIAMLETIAGAVATAVRNAQLYDQAVERFTTLETLHQMSLELADVQEPAAIARLVTEAALDLFQPNEVRFWLCHGVPDEATLWKARTTNDPDQPRIDMQPNRPLNAHVARVRQTEEPALIPDMADDRPAQIEFGTPWLVQAAVLYPIRRGGYLFAILSLLYGEPTFFRQDMLRTLDLLALQAATAFQSARYLDSLRSRLDEVIALQDLARQVSALRSLDDVLETVVETLYAVYECRSTWVALLDNESETVTLQASAGLGPEFREQAKFEVNEYVAGEVVKTGQPIYVPDTHADARFGIIDPDVRSMMVVPLTVRGRVLGALGMDGATVNAFSDEHERVLNIAGGQIAATIETIHLLEEARERAEDLAAANAILQKQDELRRELIYQVSHDLRSPLQIVYGYADMLHDAQLGPVTPSQMEILALMLKRTKAIERMTRDIMAVKPIDHDMLELELVDLNQLCRQAVIDAQLLSTDRAGLDFQTALAADEISVEADYNRLSRVLDNLLGNAVKFSPNGGTITLSTERDEENHCARIAISDEGIGIPADKLPYVFERFFRVERKRFKGSGLGLYIVQQIIQAHRGEVRAESEIGAGSTFIVSLPLPEEP